MVTGTLLSVVTVKHLAKGGGLPSAGCQTLGKGGRFAECREPDTQQRGAVCRVLRTVHSAKSACLPSAGVYAPGKPCHIISNINL